MPISSLEQIEKLFSDCPKNNQLIPDQRLPLDRSTMIDLENDVIDNFANLPNREIARGDDLAKGTLSRAAALSGLTEVPFDCIAFYKSMRYRDAYPFIGRWGVFYIYPLLKLFSETAEFQKENDPFRFALEAVYRHERRHFIGDVEVRFWEKLVFNLPLYDHWLRSIPPTMDWEEALANRDMYEWLESRGYGIVALGLLRQQPGKYGKFREKDLELRWVKQREKLLGKCHTLLNLPLPAYIRMVGGNSAFPSILGREIWLGKDIVAENLHPPQHLVGSRSLWLEDFFRDPVRFSRVIGRFHITRIIDSEPQFPRIFAKFVKKNGEIFRNKWEEVKRKAYICPQPAGLDAKFWGTDGTISLRVDDNVRAHIAPTESNSGDSTNRRGQIYKAISIGRHQEMGHGK